MGFLKPTKRKSDKRKHDVLSRARQGVSLLKGSSLRTLEIVNPKFTIRIKR